MDKDLYEAGLAMRKSVLGDAYVQRSLDAADDFTRPFQEFITEYGWGAIWTRPGLDKHTRSLLNIVMLTALNRGAELELHIGGALTNGVSREEIMEAFMHASLYCGVPASLEGFRIARKVFASLDAPAK